MGERWLSVDPGETAGWALWEGDELVDAGQDPLIEFRDEVGAGVSYLRPSRFAGISRLVIERFALYPWVAKSGALDFDEMRTSRLIGALEYIAACEGMEVIFQPATIKEFALAAGAAELFRRPLHENRHMNDAIMHGWYYIHTVKRGVKVKLPGGGEAMSVVSR